MMAMIGPIDNQIVEIEIDIQTCIDPIFHSDRSDWSNWHLDQTHFGTAAADGQDAVWFISLV